MTQSWRELSRPVYANITDIGDNHCSMSSGYLLIVMQLSGKRVLHIELATESPVRSIVNRSTNRTVFASHTCENGCDLWIAGTSIHPSRWSAAHCWTQDAVVPLHEHRSNASTRREPSGSRATVRDRISLSLSLSLCGSQQLD